MFTNIPKILTELPDSSTKAHGARLREELEKILRNKKSVETALVGLFQKSLLSNALLIKQTYHICPDSLSGDDGRPIDLVFSE